jgi:hypothetical protein
MSLRWRRNSRNAPKQTIDFKLASAPNNVLVTKQMVRRNGRGFDAVCRMSVRSGCRVMNPSHAVQELASRVLNGRGSSNNRNRRDECQVLADNSFRSFHRTMGASCRIPNRILICASGAKFVDDFCSELPVTRGKSLAATPRHLHQSTIRLT